MKQADLLDVDGHVAMHLRRNPVLPQANGLPLGETGQ